MATVLKSSLAGEMEALGRAARMASRQLAISGTQARNRALAVAAQALRANRDAILDANALDMDAARARGTRGAFLDRLKLDEAGQYSIDVSVDGEILTRVPLRVMLVEERGTAEA